MLKDEFIIRFAEKYSVHRLEDIESGMFKEVIKDDIYLIEDAEVKE